MEGWGMIDRRGKRGKGKDWKVTENCVVILKGTGCKRGKRKGRYRGRNGRVEGRTIMEKKL